MVGEEPRAVLRSTKSSSKIRRVAMASELENVSQILPISQTVKKSLSQIQLMSIVAAYVAKSNLLARLSKEGDDNDTTGGFRFNFEEALHGFILAATEDGRLLYFTENVSKFIGYSTIDLLTHNRTVYEVTDSRDHAQLKKIFDESGPMSCQTDSFVLDCRFCMARSLRRLAGCVRYKKLKVRGRFIDVGRRIEPTADIRKLFVAVCYSDVIKMATHRISNSLAAVQCFDTMTFRSCHSLDMKFISIETLGESHLGYQNGGLIGRSWYERIHPEDIENAKSKHMELISQLVVTQETRSLLLRMQTHYGHYVTINLEMRLKRSSAAKHARHQRTSTTSDDDVIIQVVNRVMEDYSSTAVQLLLELPDIESVSTNSPSSDMGQVESMLPMKSRDGLKRKSASSDTDECFNSSRKRVLSAGAETTEAYSTGVGSPFLMGLIRKLPLDVESSTVSQSSSTSGQLRNTFPLLASIISSPAQPISSYIIQGSHSKFQSRACINVVSTSGVVTDPHRVSPELCSSTMSSFKMNSSISEPVPLEQAKKPENSSQNKLLMTDFGQNNLTYHSAELQASPDSSMQPDWMEDTGDIVSVLHRQNSLDELDEQSLENILASCDDNALKTLMNDLVFRKETSTTEQTTASKSAEEFDHMSSAVMDKDTRAVTSSDETLEHRGISAVSSVTPATQLSDLLALMSSLISFTCDILVQNQITSLPTNLHSAISTTSLPIGLPAGLRQLVPGEESRMVRDTLNLDDLTSGLLTLVNRTTSGSMTRHAARSTKY